MEESSQNAKKEQYLLIKAAFVIGIFVLLTYKTFDFFGTTGYREMWSICIDYIHQGTFWSGQPRCEGGILPFYIIWILDTIFGRDLVHSATLALAMLLSAVYLWIFLKVVKKEINYQGWFLPTILFILFVYLNSLTAIETLLSSMFFFSAYYFLFHTQTKWRFIATGTALFFGLIAKFNILIPSAFLLFWYTKRKNLWDYHGFKITLRLSKEKITQITKEYTQIVSPLVAGFAILTVLVDNFWIYTFLVFRGQEAAMGYIETLQTMVLFNPLTVTITYISLIVILIMGFYVFLKEKKFFALITGPVMFLSMFMIAQSFGFGFATGFRYWTAIYPFAILTIFYLYKKSKQVPHKQLVLAGLLVLCVFPGLYMSPLTLKDDLSYIDDFNIISRTDPVWQEKDAFIKQVHYGYSIIPEQSGRILAEHDEADMLRMLESIGASIDPEQLDLLSKRYMESHPDIYGFSRFQELFGEDLIYNPNEQELSEKEQEIIAKIEQGTYSLIIFGPPEWEISQRIITNLNNETTSNFCQVAVPNNVWLTKGGWHFSYFMFTSQEDCLQMVEGMYTYFTQNYQEICEKDKDTANEITQVMRENGAPFPYVCQDGGAAVEFFKTGSAEKKRQLLVILLLLLVPIAYPLVRKRKTLTKKEQVALVIISAIIIIAILILTVLVNTTIPFATPSVATIV